MDDDLETLLANAKPMTAADHYWQRRSWMIGEMAIEHPDWPQERVVRVVELAMSNMGYVKP